MQDSDAHPAPQDTPWRLTHLGRLLGQALRRFDERVLALMASNVEVPLALSNLAARDQVGAAHIHITRHLAVGGSRLTDLSASAGMSKQAMGDLVNQCEAWGLVTREADPYDKRARRVLFTESGLLWLDAFRQAVAQACSLALPRAGKRNAARIAMIAMTTSNSISVNPRPPRLFIFIFWPVHNGCSGVGSRIDFTKRKMGVGERTTQEHTS